MNKRLLAAATLALVIGLGVQSKCQAAFFNVPVPTNAYITQGGLDWAWAYPLPASAGGFDLSYQSTLGWHIPTVLELTVAPLATDFLFPGGNVPFGGTDGGTGATFAATNAAYASAMSDGAVATPYFSTVYLHADWQDGLGQTFGPWAGMPGAESFADQLVVRDHVPDGHDVPEPASLTMLGIGAASLIGYAWKRRKTAAC